MQNLLDTWLEPLSEAPFPMAVLNDFLKEYSQPGFKAHMMVKEGKLIRLKRGWFCVNPKYSKKSINHGVVANVLYDGPSYVSIETALSYYGLIPERTMGMTSVVTGRSKTFKTPIGWFSYKSIPEDLFPIGVRSVDGYLMASPEKALCDYLYTLPDLFAGKVSAALFRKWKRRIKGRDWYDVAWYITKHVPLDLAHHVERAKESAPEADVSTPEKVIAAFDARIDAIDFENARADVEPYVMDRTELDIWSAEFFRQMVRMIKFA